MKQAIPKNNASPMAEGGNEHEARVLILAPTARDAEVTRSILHGAGVLCSAVSDLATLVRESEVGAATILMTEEALSGEDIRLLIDLLGRQPDWSDLPIVLLLRGTVQTIVAGEMLRSLGNVTLLERPAPMRSVVSAVQAAVRSRWRQYQIRDQLQQLRTADAEKHQLLEREKAARAEAERAGRIKDEFLATLSHELRTPLNAILGWAQLLTHGRNDPKTLDEGLEVIERNARVQTQIISDLLDMSRIISGKVRLDMQKVDPGAMIQAAVDAVRPSADVKGVHLRVLIDSLAGPVTADPSRLQQVVWNLVSNSIKFTPPGGKIEVRLERVNSHLEITVVDTGEGIDPAFLPHVFERFRQADASSTRSHGGLGLGLSIVKQLIEMHGGTVRAKSPGVGKGSTFIVLLPVRVIQEDEPESRDRRHPDAARNNASEMCDHVSLNGVKVLVLDDEPDARGLIKRLLEDCDAEVVTAGSASEAIEHMKLGSPDVILSDIGMPKQDGYEFLRLTRQMGIKAPAVALTAFARAEDRLRTLRAGYQNHLAKPVEPAELIATVASAVGRLGPSLDRKKQSLTGQP
jgi:signal transduction histidine kinase/ActR/RegA family two-component response regulator